MDEVHSENGTLVETSELKSGWADSMAKILGSNKPKNKKTLILSRAKKDFEVRSIVTPTNRQTTKVSAPVPVVKLNEDRDWEDIEEEAPIKKSKVEGNEDESMLSVKAQRKIELQQRKQLREWENISRVKPDPSSPSEKSRERELVKIATKGVVQLFNAVNLQQKALKDKLHGARQSEFKKDKVLYQSKEIFDSAMTKSKRLGGDHSSSDEDDLEVKDEDDSGSDFEPAEATGTITFKTRSGGSLPSVVNGKKNNQNSNTSSKKPRFKALHDDYMMGSAKLKDWKDNSDGEDTE